MGDKVQEFTPTETCGQFMVSEARVRALVGPVGSSKTTTCLYEVLRRAMEQEPAEDGKRYTRWAFVRNTLKNLKDTILKDFQQLFGDVITYRVSDSAIYIRHGDIDCEILLMPLEHEDDQRRLLSAQLTGIYFNEFSEVNPDFISPALGRCGRYPSQSRGVPTWNGIIMDSNPGTEDSPWFSKLKIDLPPTWEYFEQPSPFLIEEDEEGEEYIVENPACENIRNLPPNPKNLQKDPDAPLEWTYYYDLMDGATPQWIGRYIMGQWGRSLEGEPVFMDRFDEDFHISYKPLITSYEHPIIIGMDFARVPAAVFGQLNHNGRLLIKKEAYAMGQGLAFFVETQVLPILHEEWCVGRPVYVVGDPSGVIKDRRNIDDFDYLRSVGFDAYKAPTNKIEPRIHAVDKWLLKQFGGEAAIQFDAVGCPELIMALKDKYRYKKRRDGTMEDTPDKKMRPWADLADALQYLCLGTDQRIVGHVMKQYRPRPVTPPPAVGAWT